MRNRIQALKHSGRRVVLGVLAALALGALSGCEGLLDVELPDQIAEESLQDPQQAQLLVNSAIGRFECTWSEFVASNAAGNEDVYMRITGWWASFAEYEAEVSGGNCNVDDFFYGWWNSLHAGRGLAEDTYANLDTAWVAEEVPGDREEMMAQLAIYAGLNYELLGEHLCEIAVDGGPLMTPDETLEEAESWLTSALDHIETTGDFAIVYGGDQIASSAEQMARLIRARVRFSLGDSAGAQADAEAVEQGFVAVATREQSSQRARGNRVFTAHNEDHWGTVQGPIGGEEWLSLGVASGFPEQIPFTGYQNLGVTDPEGRAVTAEGYPVTTEEFAGAEADPRVPVEPVGEFNEWDDVWEQRKYTSPGDDIPIANWEEAWLILAEIGDATEAISRVNDIREEYGLPTVDYLDAGASPEEIERMIIEERRRSLFLEGRFWSTKLRKDLWFPRGTGQTPFNNPYSVGVRQTMPSDEYDLNENFDISDQGTLCGDEAPGSSA